MGIRRGAGSESGIDRPQILCQGSHGLYSAIPVENRGVGTVSKRNAYCTHEDVVLDHRSQ